jgi:hypothetical protein
MSSDNDLKGWKKHHISAGIVSIHAVEELVRHYHKHLSSSHMPHQSASPIDIDRKCELLRSTWLRNMTSMNTLPFRRSYNEYGSVSPHHDKVLAMNPLSSACDDSGRVIDNNNIPIDNQHDVMIESMGASYSAYCSHFLDPMPRSCEAMDQDPLSTHGQPCLFMARPQSLHDKAVLDKSTTGLGAFEAVGQRRGRARGALPHCEGAITQSSSGMAMKLDTSSLGIDMGDIIMEDGNMDDIEDLVNEIRTADLDLLFDDNNDTGLDLQWANDTHARHAHARHPSRCHAALVETASMSEELLQRGRHGTSAIIHSLFSHNKHIIVP